jgi:transglutaminase/protease-like cytokinesis protein 3
MNRLIYYTAVLLLFLHSSNSFAQTPDPAFKVVDEYVKSLGSLDTLNMGTISYIVTKKFPENKDKVRAIFDWIAYNISFDCKSSRNNGNEKNDPDYVLKSRKATASGYAALFQDMCSVAKIRCLTVDGYAKYTVEQIDNKPDEFNHTWIVVQLGQSPETWHYVDPTWGSGYTDDKMTVYTKSYNDAYFFADKKTFDAQHFADNKAWQLSGGSKSIKDFLSLPVVKHAAYEYGISSFAPTSGMIKAKTKVPVQFSYRINNNAVIDIVALQLGSDKKVRNKTVDYVIKNNTITFSYKFEEEDSYPVTILINGKPVLGYIVEVTE